jgi:hypothetical protein
MQQLDENAVIELSGRGIPHTVQKRRVCKPFDTLHDVLVVENDRRAARVCSKLDRSRCFFDKDVAELVTSNTKVKRLCGLFLLVRSVVVYLHKTELVGGNHG